MYLYFILIFRGSCGSRGHHDISEDLDHLSPIEKKLHEFDKSFHLTKVKFHKFRAALKKYAYSTPLTLAHLRCIQSLISLDLDQMILNPSTDMASLLYLD